MDMNNKISDLISFALPRGWEMDRYDYTQGAEARDELYSRLLPDGRDALEAITESIVPEASPYPTQYTASPLWSSDDNAAGIAVFSNTVTYSNSEFELIQRLLAQDGPLPLSWVTDPKQNYSLFSCWYWNEAQSYGAMAAPPVFEPDADPALVEAFFEMKAYLQQIESQYNLLPVLRFEVHDAYTVTLNNSRAAVVECFETSEKQLRRRTGIHLILDQTRETDGWLAAELHIFLHANTSNETYVQPQFRQFLRSLKWTA